MSTAFDTTAFDRGIEPILRLLTPTQAREIVAFRGDDALQERIELLAEKSNEGAMTEAETAEYEGYVKANKFIAILQAKAQQLLVNPDA